MANFNEGAEIAPLVCLIKNPSLYPIIEDSVSVKSFSWHSFATIYSVFRDLYNQDILADKFTLMSELQARDLLETISVPSVGMRGRDAIEYMLSLDIKEELIEHYAFQLVRIQSIRELVVAHTKAIEKLSGDGDPLAVMAQYDIDSGKVAIMLGAKSNSFKTAEDIALAVVDEYKMTVSGEKSYIKTGIRAWDEFTNGLYEGRLYIVSAVSNDGKSSLVQNLLYNISIKNPIKGVPLKKGCLISMEASASEVFRKLIQRITGISALRIEAGELSEEEEKEMAKAVELIAESKVIFDDSSELILPLVRNKIRKAKENGAEYIIIDQLEQILLGGSGDAQAEHIKLNFISYRIKAYAREMNIPIILVHQMNRSIDSGDRRGKNVDPQIQDLAQAGEKAADAILMIRHKKQGQQILESYFWWVKNRQGKKGFQQVKFTGERILFEDLDENSIPTPDWLQKEMDDYDKEEQESYPPPS